MLAGRWEGDRLLPPALLSRTLSLCGEFNEEGGHRSLRNLALKGCLEAPEGELPDPKGQVFSSSGKHQILVCISPLLVHPGLPSFVARAFEFPSDVWPAAPAVWAEPWRLVRIRQGVLWQEGSRVGAPEPPFRVWGCSDLVGLL